MSMNKAKYDALPADLKKIIDNNTGMATSAFLGKVQQEGDIPGRKATADRGNNIFTVSAAEAQDFKNKSSLIDDEWVADMNKRGYDGKKLLETAKALIAKHTKAK